MSYVRRTRCRNRSRLLVLSAACGEHGTAELCPEDPQKTEPGVCGCGERDDDANDNGVPDSLDAGVDYCETRCDVEESVGEASADERLAARRERARPRKTQSRRGEPKRLGYFSCGGRIPGLDNWIAVELETRLR